MTTTLDLDELERRKRGWLLSGEATLELDEADALIAAARKQEALLAAIKTNDAMATRQRIRAEAAEARIKVLEADIARKDEALTNLSAASKAVCDKWEGKHSAGEVTGLVLLGNLFAATRTARAALSPAAQTRSTEGCDRPSAQDTAEHTIRDAAGHRRFIDKHDDLSGWTDDELRHGIADYQAIIDAQDDSTYGGVAEGDCCAHSRDVLKAELKRRATLPAADTAQPVPPPESDRRWCYSCGAEMEYVSVCYECPNCDGRTAMDAPPGSGWHPTQPTTLNEFVSHLPAERQEMVAARADELRGVQDKPEMVCPECDGEGYIREADVFNARDWACIRCGGTGRENTQ